MQSATDVKNFLVEDLKLALSFFQSTIHGQAFVPKSRENKNKESECARGSADTNVQGHIGPQNKKRLAPQLPWLRQAPE